METEKLTKFTREWMENDINNLARIDLKFMSGEYSEEEVQELTKNAPFREIKYNILDFPEVLFEPVQNMPLFISHEQPIIRTVAKWRLKIGH